MNTRVLINVPSRAKRGEVVEIKALIGHVMETGFRRDETGKVIPRNIITRLECHYDGEEIFYAEFSPAVAANPFVRFFTVATASGLVSFRWRGDNGFEHLASAVMTVE